MIKEARFYYWGPLLLKIILRNEEIQALKKLCNEAQLKKIDHRKHLVGVIKEELTIDKKKYAAIVEPYLDSYLVSYENWYGRKIKKIETGSVWVNFMKKGEFNPPHIHPNYDLSSVLYLDIPPGLKKEAQQFKGKPGGPGAVNFFIAGPQAFHNNFHTFQPEVGDFFIFPWTLTHFVGPFQSSGTRTSIAANFKIKA
tara:strand:- start:17 stop:607 length:591 start_codon:yes stop_codon:yes gene_type:complete